MEEKKFVLFKKEELKVKEHIKRVLGKGRISSVEIKYTPIGEKIIVSTSKPGLVIGKSGEKINELTRVLKRMFKFDNPHIEIDEIKDYLLDAKLVADEISLLLERRGSLKFKVIAYKMLREIVRRGAIGVEIVLSGKLPSDRARTWRFSHGYLKKTGDPAKLVDRAKSQAKTISGVVGVQVSIIKPGTVFHDQLRVDDQMRDNIKRNVFEKNESNTKTSKKKKTGGKK